MKDLAVVIVNYNVEYFLEQCLTSVFRAQKNLDIAVYVVDNNSVDGSVEMVRRKFPQVHLIANRENVGFSVANNQAIRMSDARYVLLLNPDTVVQEDCFEQCIAFMDAHPEAGAMGVKMIDGLGKFLPESKRGLPTPAVAFYKIFGIARLFPRSRRFGKYHLTYLDPNEVHEIDVLAGAFMLMRKEALDKVGVLDEDFFMYGEDIDLSYRIQQGGYKNFYYPHTKIIHYKGESTKKGSLNYVLVFYRAMILFAQKHFARKSSRLFSWMIMGAVYLRMTASLFRRMVTALFWPVADMVAGAVLYTLLIRGYEQAFVKHIPWELLRWLAPGHLLLLLITTALTGVYYHNQVLRKCRQALFYGLLATLVGYSFLPEDWRFSRLVITLVPLLLFAWQIFSRWLSDRLAGTHYFKTLSARNVAIIGDRDEIKRVSETLKTSSTRLRHLIPVYTDGDRDRQHDWQQVRLRLKEMVRIHQLDEIIFCPKNLELEEIMHMMVQSYQRPVEFKMAPPESLFIIGSSSINTRGEIYIRATNHLGRRVNLLRKRFFDGLVAVAALFCFPLLLWTPVHRKMLRYIPAVLAGKKTWIGLNPSADNHNDLPIPAGVFLLVDPAAGEKQITELNFVYQEDYHWQKDLTALLHWLGKV